jgi:hypothetical protein
MMPLFNFLIVVHVCLTDDAAKSEGPKIISGDLAVEPASGLGSNVQRKVEDRLTPRAVLCGGGYGQFSPHSRPGANITLRIPEEAFEALKKLVGEKAAEIAWIKVCLLCFCAGNGLNTDTVS